MRLHLLFGSLLTIIVSGAGSEILHLNGRFHVFTTAGGFTQLEKSSDRLFHRGSGRREQRKRLYPAIAQA